jgi:hypothetical protein
MQGPVGRLAGVSFTSGSEDALMRYLQCLVVVVATVAAGCTREGTPITGPPNGPPAVRANASGAVATATPQASAGYRVTCALRQEGSLACGDGRCALAV